MTEDKIVICGHGSGNPSTKNMQTYLESRYQSFMSNGVRKQLVSVRRLKELNTAELRKAFHDTYKTILGRNVYSQDLRDYCYVAYKGCYYSDCSSSGCLTYKKIGLSCQALNTATIYTSDLFEDVQVVIENGHILNPEALRVGDALLFAGNLKRDYVKYIGHVEYIYEMPTEEETYTETPCTGTVEITAEALNCRTKPNTTGDIVCEYPAGEKVSVTAKSGTWFKTDKGWISRKYVKGWIAEGNKWWYILNGAYPYHCAMDIDGTEYHFDKAGWMLTSDRIAASGGVRY